MVLLNDILQFVSEPKSKVEAFVIDEDGLDHRISRQMIPYHIAEGLKTVKIEGLEHLLVQYKPKTVHCFISKSGAPSFPEHTDLCDVTILCISGTKTISISGVENTLHEGDSVFIPEGTVHRATNKHDSIILSIGD
jgi:mannose-6-phosphate isomerase-like protein (cupin superfamily)